MFEILLRKLAKELDDKDIHYMVIGGQAVLLYGEPRLTRDIDITLGLKPDGYEKIREIADNLKLKVLVDNPEEFLKKTMVLPVIESKSGIRVDFIFSFSEYEKQALKRINRVEIDDYKVKFASLEDVVIHKIISGRPRDIEDVKSILIKNPDFDRKYIENWLEEFDRSLKENFSRTFTDIEKEVL